jgi:glycosyltransferase involved in cell wall biosynthesis
LVEDGRTGVLVPPDDPASLAAALETLIGSPQLRATMGDAARERFREFSATRVVPKIERVYMEIVGDVRPAVSAGT